MIVISERKTNRVVSYSRGMIEFDPTIFYATEVPDFKDEGMITYCEKGKLSFVETPEMKKMKCINKVREIISKSKDKNNEIVIAIEKLLLCLM